MQNRQGIPEFLLKWVDSADPLNPVEKWEWAPEDDVFPQWPRHVFYFWKSIKTPIKNFGFVSHRRPPAQPADHDPTVESATDDLLPFDDPDHLRHKYLPEPPLRTYTDIQQRIMHAAASIIRQAAGSRDGERVGQGGDSDADVDADGGSGGDGEGVGQGGDGDVDADGGSDGDGDAEVKEDAGKGAGLVAKRQEAVISALKRQAPPALRASRRQVH